MQVSANADFINPFTNEEAIKKALTGNLRTLFKLPGELGNLMNSQLYRGGLLALQAPEKSAKSYILQELIMRALKDKIKVAVFELGDMTEGDRLCRIGYYITKRPFSREHQEEGIKKCRIPELIENDGERIVKFREETHPILTAEAMIAAGKNWVMRCGKDSFRLSTHASDTTSIGDINTILETWRDIDDWVPDLIAIDYPDIAKVERHGMDTREAVNTRWKAMRRMAHEWNCLVATVTQADANSYGKRKQSMGNFSEDKRKNSHVTAIYAINQTIEERSQNIYRIGPLAVRGENIDVTKNVAILHCLDLGRPYITSYVVDVTGSDEDENE